MYDEKRTGRVSLPALIGIAAVLALFGIFVLWPDGEIVKPKPPKGSDPIPSDRMSALKQNAFELQITGKWCEARDAWKEVSQLTADENDLGRQEAEANHRAMTELCSPIKDLVGINEAVEIEPAADPPEPIGKDALLRYYPIGRKQHSVGQFEITGTGSNQDWFWKTGAQFNYRYSVAVESKVVAGTDVSVTFRQRFVEVAQTLATSETEIELVAPENPLADIVWEQLDKSLRAISPVYVAGRKSAELANTVDPGLKRTLTAFADTLRQYDVPVPESEDVRFFGRVDELQGLELELVYVSGLGVTRVTPLNVARFDASELRQIAQGSGSLLDYYIFPGAEKNEGDTWTVRAEDISNLFSLVGPETSVSGELQIERKPDRAVSGETLAVLALRPGDDVRLLQSDDAEEWSALATVRSGEVLFDKNDLMAVQGRVSWSGTTDRFSKDHLLFGTKQLRDVRVKSRFQSQKIDDAAPASGDAAR